MRILAAVVLCPFRPGEMRKTGICRFKLTRAKFMSRR